MNYTKGEWKAGEIEGCSQIRISAIDTSQGYESDTHIAYVDGATETKANANLIASAPELYEACKGAKWCAEQQLINSNIRVNWQQVVSDLTQALAKAEGGK